MFLIVETWREIDTLNNVDKPIQNSSNQSTVEPECSFPGPDFINDLVLVGMQLFSLKTTRNSTFRRVCSRRHGTVTDC